MKEVRTKDVKITCDGVEVGEIIELSGVDGRIYIKARITDPAMVSRLIDELPGTDSWIKDGVLLSGTVDASRNYPAFQIITDD